MTEPADHPEHLGEPILTEELAALGPECDRGDR